jgi:hypothetical protein
MSQATTSPPPKPVCDIVMKGGITSGVVYPKAIVEIASKYRLRRVGGSSAGAIAAAAAAAAQLGECRTDQRSGFELLSTLPAHLGEPIQGQSRLQQLFQPQWTVRQLFNVLLAGMDPTKSSGWMVFEAIKSLWWEALPWAYPGMILLFWTLKEELTGTNAGLDGSFAIFLQVLNTSFQVTLAVTLSGLGFGLLLGLIRKKKHSPWNWFVAIQRPLAVFVLVLFLWLWSKANLNITGMAYWPLVLIASACLVFLFGNTFSKGKSTASIVIWQFVVPFLAGAVLIFALILGWQNQDAVQLFSIVFYTLVTWSGFLFGVALNVIVRLLRRLPENNFGLCNGSFPDQLETTANIPWWEQQRLHDKEDSPNSPMAKNPMRTASAARNFRHLEQRKPN